MNIEDKEDLKEVIASVLYAEVTNHYELSERIVDSILMSFTVEPN